MATLRIARAALLWALPCSLIACGGATPAAEVVDESDRANPGGGKPLAAELPAREVVIKLRGNETELRRCFFANPSARGSLQLSWRVTSEGRVEKLRREHSTLSEPRIEECLAEKLSEVRFDPRPEPIGARWTFVFRLVEPPKARPGRKPLTKKDRARAQDNEQGVELEKDSPGFLAPDVVDNVVESGFPLFARCYRDGVQRNSSLDGAVRLRFVVGESGNVTTVEDSGSDLTDRQVVDCVAEGFYALRFPEPQRGDAHLVFRIHFDSG